MSTIVIKIGGGEGIELGPVLEEFAHLVRAGERAVLVHGGSHETNVISERLGTPPAFIKSPSGHESRRTDRQTLEIFEMVYCGKVNKAIVEHLQAAGVNAVGLSGIDGGLWTGQAQGRDPRGRRRRADDDHPRRSVGQGRVVRRVADRPAARQRARPRAHAPRARRRRALGRVAINVDADRAAAATASAIGADELLLLSNVPGVLADPERPSSAHRRDRLGLEAVRSAGGRMKNKVLAAEEALNGGVGRVVIGSANGESPDRRRPRGRRHRLRGDARMTTTTDRHGDRDARHAPRPTTTRPTCSSISSRPGA
jgi:acetylglutamate/LysW-gamma-L-alpha-aminoadipate kinase